MRFQLLAYLTFVSFGLLSQTLITDKQVDEIHLEKNVDIYRNENPLELSQISNADWQRHDQIPNFGISDRLIWIRYSVINQSNNPIKQWIYYPYHHTSSIQISQVHNKDTALRGFLGTFHHGGKTALISGHSLEVTLQPGKNIIIAKIKHLHLPVRVSAYLLSKPRLERIILQNATNNAFWHGVILCGFVVVLLGYV
ncbi:MAG: hypothetical protein N4A46_15970, partial [Schleiferiaceae bacterium]|nr:hypothetical protein [Schleiferiaceae bacterium]